MRGYERVGVGRERVRGCMRGLGRCEGEEGAREGVGVHEGVRRGRERVRGA